MLVLALAAVLYSSRPFYHLRTEGKQRHQECRADGTSADERTSCGSNRLPRNPAMISANAVVPTSVRKAHPAMARIQNHKPLASRSNVLFMKSMVFSPVFFRSQRGAVAK